MRVLQAIAGASGGAIKVRGDLHLWRSTITDNESVTGPAVAIGDRAGGTLEHRVVISGSHVREDDVALAGGRSCPRAGRT